MDYELIFQKVTEVYEKCCIKTLPVDAKKILNTYGFKMYTYSEIYERNKRLYNICSLYSNDALQYDDKIAYNEKKNLRRIQFTLMHELGHYLLKTSVEEEADYFASCILAPRILIHSYKCRTADQIHDIFGLSYAASNRALSDYKKWYYRKTLDSELRLEKIFFPSKDEPKIIEPIIELREKPARKSKGNSRKWKAIEKKIAFFQEHDPDYFFRRAEHNWLYGNDL